MTIGKQRFDKNAQLAFLRMKPNIDCEIRFLAAVDLKYPRSHIPKSCVSAYVMCVCALSVRVSGTLLESGLIGHWLLHVCVILDESSVFKKN